MMASIRANGVGIPFTLPLGEDGKVYVDESILEAKFGLQMGRMYVEQELTSDVGDVVETVLQLQSRQGDSVGWMLSAGSYKVFGYSSSALQGSTVCLTPASVTSTVLLTPPVRVKIEPHTEPITLLSDSDDDIVPTVDLTSTCPFPFKRTPSSSVVRNYSNSQLQRTPSGSAARPPRSPTFSLKQSSMLDALKATAVRPRSQSALSDIDFDNIRVEEVKYIPTTYDGDVIFLLPPLPSGLPATYGKSLDGMDKVYDGKPWCTTKTSNIRNDCSLIFRRSVCAGHLECANDSCEYLFRNGGVRNNTQWTGITHSQFRVGGAPPLKSTFMCKVCLTPPSCLAICDAQLYHVTSANPAMHRAFVHLGHHNHPVAEGVCRDSLDLTYEFLASEVSRTPKATNSAIQMAASKNFLADFLFKTPTPGEKQPSLESVMDRFAPLASPNCRNIVSASRRLVKSSRAPMEGIIDLKKNPHFKFVHDNRFPGQCDDKVFIFKMSVDLEGSGVDLVKRMQVGGDLQDAWIMFDNVKRVKEWTTLACHVYDTTYCKVMTIACCDMQSEDAVAQTLFWENLNKVMAENGVPNVNFKGFMADSAQANWIAVRKVYGSGNPDEPMEDRERTCFYHWSANLDKYTTKYIKPEMQFQHKQLCRNYRDAKTQREADEKYHTIRAWWATSGAARDECLSSLSEWLGFWHHRYRQWGGQMILVRLIYLLFFFLAIRAYCLLKLTSVLQLLL